MNPNVYSSTINNSQTMERAQMYINWWMDREDVVYLYAIEYYLSKEWNLAICNDEDGARMYYVKWNKSGRLRQIPYDFTHMWSLRKKTDEHMGRGKKREREKETNHRRLFMTENKLRFGGGRWVGDGPDGWWVLRRALVMLSIGCKYKCWITKFYSWKYCTIC